MAREGGSQRSNVAVIGVVLLVAFVVLMYLLG